MPLLLLLVVCLAMWIALSAERDGPPADVTLILRVRDSAPELEAILRDAQRAGFAHLTVVDEGSSDGSAAIATLWARGHAGVEIRRAMEADGLGASVLVLDLRGPAAARAAQRTLRWLAGGLLP